jgi:hypothetical protein
MPDVGFAVSTPSKIKRRDRPRRSARPERITIAGKEFARNDVLAAEGGITERTLNRGDARGDPYLMLYGVKYRPVEEHAAYLLGKVKRRNQASAGRRRGAR